MNNPNFFSVSLKHLKLEVRIPNYYLLLDAHIRSQLFYPINNTALGNGEEDNIKINSNQQTNFTFPFALKYITADDPSKAVLTDLASKCVGGQDLKINYKITVSIPSFLLSLEFDLTQHNLGGAAYHRCGCVTRN